MRLYDLPSLGLASILFNGLLSQAHNYVGGGKLTFPAAPASTEKLVGTNWQLTEINGAAALPDIQELFFETDTEASGYDGCNRFRAEWSEVDTQTGDRPSIMFDVMMTNRRMCRLTAEAGKQHLMFRDMLRQEAISFSLSEDEKELTLYRSLDGKDTPLVFSSIPRPVQPHERLIGTNWIATEIVYPDSQDELRPVLENTPVTLSFPSADEIKGFTGVNQYFGEISKMTSTEFQVDSVGTTYVGVEDDDPRGLQENAWMSILNPDAVTTLPYTLFDERIGDTDEWTKVLILGSFQAPLARFVPLKDGVLDPWGERINRTESPGADDTPSYEDNWHETISLAGSNWKATEIRGTPLKDDSDPEPQFLTDVNMFFSSESSVQGSGGCNQFHASWKLTEMDDIYDPRIRESLEVWGMMSSFMHCVDKMISQVENNFFSGLRQELILFEFDGEEINLWDAVKNENGQKERGNFIGRFINIPVPSWGGESLIGMAGEDAKGVINSVNPSLQVSIIPPGWGMTADHRLDRVRIFVDEDGNVTREPQRG